MDIYRLAPSHIVWLLHPVADEGWEQFGLFRSSVSSETWVAPEVRFISQQAERVGAYPDVNDVAGVPVLSPRATAVFLDLVGGRAELVPIPCADAELVGLFVPELVGALDIEASEVTRFSDGGIMWINSPVFDPAVIGDVAAFRLAEYPGSVYVDGRVVEAAAAARLAGFRADHLWSERLGAIEQNADRSIAGRHAVSVDDIETLDDLALDEAMWDRACELAGNGSAAALQAMPSAVRAFYATRLFEWEVGNGGLHQFFFNQPEPAMWEAVAAGYELFGDAHGVEIAAKVLPPLATRDAEWRALLRDGTIETFFESYLDDRLAGYDDRAVGRHDVGRLRFVRAHPHLFSV